MSRILSLPSEIDNLTPSTISNLLVVAISVSSTETSTWQKNVQRMCVDMYSIGVFPGTITPQICL